MDFSAAIINWYLQNKRDLPWRECNDPYRIWVSEIILQQTRVDQGLPYYFRFLKQFPDLSALASASEEEVLKCWQGLGYYSRARNMQAAAQYIVTNLNGIFPDSFDKIKEMKGVGDYTAAAIASFAFGIAQAVVDGNVFRVLSRCFAIDTPVDTTSGKKEFFELAQHLLDKKRPALHNQAIMDLGATICTPQAPQCPSCPICDLCLALEKKQIDSLPVKQKKTKTRDRHFFYLLISLPNDCTIVHQRTGKDIWQGLYELPLIEQDDTVEHLTESVQYKELENRFLGLSINKIHHSVKHQLTHQTIYATLIEASANKAQLQKDEELTDMDLLKKYPMSKLMEILLKKAD
jgi:A/G-specific adenine glycosylase